ALATNPRLAEKFEALADYAELRDWDRTTRLLLQLFEADDVLVPVVRKAPGQKDVRVLVGLHAEARARLAGLAAEGKEAYRRKASAEAARLLAEARKDRDTIKLDAVARRFPDTPAAAEALEELAVRHARDGHYQFSALYFRRLAEQRGPEQWTPEAQLEAAT